MRSLKINCIICLTIFLASCGAKEDHPGFEYAPNMYHSVPYEGLSQITDKEAGALISNRPSGNGEFYNSNPYNPYTMNLRKAPENTVPRNPQGYLPYRIPKDSLLLAARVMKNPLPDNEVILADGKELFERFCIHCHGAEGLGGETGTVGAVFGGVTSYTSAAVKDVPEGHIFHVITHGKGRMQAHGSQLNPDERWKIVRYVQTLQKQ